MCCARKNAPISTSASEVKSKLTKKPFLRPCVEERGTGILPVAKHGQDGRATSDVAEGHAARRHRPCAVCGIVPGISGAKTRTGEETAWLLWSKLQRT